MHGYTRAQQRGNSGNYKDPLLLARRRRPERTDGLHLIRNSHPVQRAGNLASFYERPKNPINIILIAECIANHSSFSQKALPRERVAGSSKNIRCLLPSRPSSRSTLSFRDFELPTESRQILLICLSTFFRLINFLCNQSS